LNKKDIFSEKIKRSDLSVCFPDYQGFFSFPFFGASEQVC
jgi:hypothetical protein